ncbi:MAG: ABC transporter substrate-binding protein [Deferrisomatales bacterium]|nr:ABC transporter substrate-binding protein [Deferrisomatales bacterium]
MRRCRTISAVCIAVLLAGLIVGAQPAVAGPATILVLGGKDAPPYREALQGFRDTLAQQGVAATLDVQFFGDDEKQGRTRVEAAAGRGDRLIFALGSAATRLASAQAKVPVVATLVLDAAAIRGAANVTGVPLGFPVEAELQWVQRLLPDRQRVGVLYNTAQNGEIIAEARRQARKLGLELVAQEVHTAKDLPDALESLANKVDVLWGVADSVVLSPETAKAILLFSFRNRIPFVGLSEAWVKAGALYSLERDYADLGAQCAGMAGQLLQGKGAAAVPVEAPRRVLYSLNQKTAERMKVEIPQPLVRDAKKIYD